MKDKISVLPVLLVVIGILVCLVAISKRLDYVACCRCEVWPEPICEELNCLQK
jgi:hypothetical protein